MMFVRTVYGGLINVNDIMQVSVERPNYEQTSHTVVAYIRGYGTRILFRGTETECEVYLCEFEKKFV